MAEEERMAEMLASFQFQIFVKHPTTNRSISIMVCDDSSIASVKKQFAEKEGIDICWLRLLYKGKPLQDDKKVGYYDIKKGENIWCNSFMDGFVPNYSKIVVYFYKK